MCKLKNDQSNHHIPEVYDIGLILKLLELDWVGRDTMRKNLNKFNVLT